VISRVNCLLVTTPESNPAGFPPAAAKYTQGFAKEPCVTECSTELRMNVTMVPLLAVMFGGLYVKPLI